MSGSTKSAKGVPGFCALSAIDLLRRPPSGGGCGLAVCRRSAGASFGGAGAAAGLSAGFAANGSPALISSLNSSRISPSAVKIRLSVTLISDLGLSVIAISSLGGSGDRKRYSKYALIATAATIRALAMRIVQILEFNQFNTGSVHQMFQSAAGLRERGHDVTIVSRPDDVLAAKAAAADVKFVGLAMGHQFGAGSGGEARKPLF